MNRKTSNCLLKTKKNKKKKKKTTRDAQWYFSFVHHTGKSLLDISQFSPYNALLHLVPSSNNNTTPHNTNNPPAKSEFSRADLHPNVSPYISTLTMHVHRFATFRGNFAPLERTGQSLPKRKKFSGSQKKKKKDAISHRQNRSRKESIKKVLQRILRLLFAQTVHANRKVARKFRVEHAQSTIQISTIPKIQSNILQPKFEIRRRKSRRKLQKKVRTQKKKKKKPANAPPSKKSR